MGPRAVYESMDICSSALWIDDDVSNRTTPFCGQKMTRSDLFKYDFYHTQLFVTKNLLINVQVTSVPQTMIRQKYLRPEDIRKDSPFVFFVFFEFLSAVLLSSSFLSISFFPYSFSILSCLRIINNACCQALLLSEWISSQAVPSHGTLVLIRPYRPVGFISGVSLPFLRLPFTFMLGSGVCEPLLSIMHRLCEDTVSLNESLEGDNDGTAEELS